MWVISGPFDSEQVGDETSEKTKLLKPNRKYGVGRHKESALTINNKKVSRSNGEFIVGEHSADDVLNAVFVPTLTFRNTKSATMKVTRGDNPVIVNPQSTYELESGDVIRVANNVNAKVIWAPIICYYTPGDDAPAFDLLACAAVGVKLVTKHSRDVTHHITSSITAPLHSSMLLSLLNPACLVTPPWLLELLSRGQDAGGLEKTCDIPPERIYCPVIDPTVAEQNPYMATTAPWESKLKRKGLFDSVKFVFALIGNGFGSPTKAMADVVIRGGADRQLINVEREAEEQDKGASGTWGTVLKKRKVVLKEGMRSGLVLVGDTEAMTARGVPKNIKKAWENMVEKAKSVNMRVIDPSLVAEAIFKADVSLLDCVTEDTDVVIAGGSTNAPLPDCVPSTLPEETSQLSGVEIASQTRPPNSDHAAQPVSQLLQAPVAGPSRRLMRRAASQTPAPEPASSATPMSVDDDSQSAPKRLRRRANAGGLLNQLLGLDDSTVLEESQLPQLPTEQLVPPTPARPGRLTRRAGTAAATQLIHEFQPSLETREEPTLRKFKALFEESGQGISSQADDGDPAADGGVGVAESPLAVVVEEEEEEEEEDSQALRQTRKRKASVMEEDEREIGGDIEMLGPSTTKKRAIEAVNAVERSQNPVSHSLATMGSTPRVTVIPGNATGTTKGAAPGKPDTDPSFLRAIASNKRGKKLEDNFDREFNQLRIAKPVADAADANASHAVQSGREWDGLGDFEKDVGIRGNFMQIVELKVWRDGERRPGRNVRRESGIGARLDWDGREDFKKFKKKLHNGSRAVVTLVLSGQQDYASEAPYFDYRGDKKAGDFDDNSQSQSQNQSQSYPVFTQSLPGSRSRPKSQAKAKGKARPKILREVMEDEDDDEVEAKIGGLKSQSKGKSQASRRTKASQSAKKKQPLFDPDSEDEDLPPKPSDETIDNDEMTLSSSKGNAQAQETKRKTRGTKRKLVLEEDSDSDQGLTFGGFSKRARRK